MALFVATLAFGTGEARAQFAPMSFHVGTLTAPACGDHCPEVIVAEGVIEKETPQAFLDFLRDASTGRVQLRRVVFLNSPGGNVVASMAFGELLHRLRAAAMVGRFDAASGRSEGPYAGQCFSACVYALMGAVKRVAPAGSQVGLHRMSITEQGAAVGAGAPPQIRTYADAPMVAVLARYARRMGIDPRLVLVAETLQGDSVHMLTREEMQRWRLASGRF